MSKIEADNLTRRGAGRPKGSPNRTTALLRDAILKAAEATGEDGQGKEGLMGYCTFFAKEEPRAFATLLGKVLPMQISGEVSHSHTTKEQRDAVVAAALRADL
ncbi:hypothetical protein [Shinella sp.]|uniref:hypothetical protein n=1 Tax=Shinella sp. TaxID=1870904 RepID=UPI00301D96D9